MSSFYKNIALWLVIGIIIVIVFDYVNTTKGKKLEEVPLSEFMQKVDHGDVREITIFPGEQLLQGTFTDAAEFKT